MLLNDIGKQFAPTADRPFRQAANPRVAAHMFRFHGTKLPAGGFYLQLGQCTPLLRRQRDFVPFACKSAVAPSIDDVDALLRVYRVRVLTTLIATLPGSGASPIVSMSSWMNWNSPYPQLVGSAPSALAPWPPVLQRM